MLRIAILAPSPWSETSIAVGAHLAESGYPPVGAISLPLWHIKTLLRKSVQWGRYDFGKYAVRKFLTRRRAVGRPPLLPFLTRNGRLYRSLYETARTYKFPVLIAKDFNTSKCVDHVRDWRVDLLIYTGGGLLRRPLIEAARIGVLNAHDALLPEVRGMSCPEWSLLLGIPPGVTVILMDSGIDTGPILIRRELNLLNAPASLGSLRDLMAADEVRLIAEAVAELDRGTLKPIPQSVKEDRQYFVMHDTLKKAAEQRLAQYATEVRNKHPESRAFVPVTLELSR